MPNGYDRLEFTSLDIASNGKLVVAGVALRSEDLKSVPHVARLSASGQLDTWPSQQLRLQLAAVSPPASRINGFRDMVAIDNLQSVEDDVVAVGMIFDDTESQGLIARFDGQSGTSAYRAIPESALGADRGGLSFSKVQAGAEGRPVAMSDLFTAAVWRFQPDLSNDPTFANKGVRILNHEDDAGYASDAAFPADFGGLAVQDGAIYAARPLRQAQAQPALTAKLRDASNDGIFSNSFEMHIVIPVACPW